MPNTPPYGGELVSLIVTEARAGQIKAASKDYASLTLDDSSLCSLELLAVGGYSPLKSFMGQADYLSVLQNMRLADGSFWPVPVTLPIGSATSAQVGQPLALRDVYGNLVGLLHVDEIYAADLAAEAACGNKTAGPAGHYAAGRLEVVRTPPHFDFVPLRHTPAELRGEFARRGWASVVAFPHLNPARRSHEAFARKVVNQTGSGLLIHPPVGVTKPGDVGHYSRLRCYKALLNSAFTPAEALLSIRPMAELPASGARATLLHAIVSRNYGCTHMIAGGDPEDSANKLSINDLKDYAREIGVSLIALEPLAYSAEQETFVPVAELPPGVKVAEISDAQVRDDYLAHGLPLPGWFTRPAVTAILLETSPPKSKQGLTIWFTGLSGSGKSTVAHALVERLAEYGRNAAFLDGDEIRTHLSKGLGFSREDRDTNINRVGYVAGLIAAQGGTTICSVVSPYRATREKARATSKGNFVEIFCDTPIDVCETRDVKGFYAKARAAVAEGKGLGFTGVDDPYEPPLEPEVTLDTSRQGVDECVRLIESKLLELGYLKS